jgi:hypothetical protein
MLMMGDGHVFKMPPHVHVKLAMINDDGEMINYGDRTASEVNSRRHLSAHGKTI